MDALDNFTLITHVRDDLQAWAAKHSVRVTLSLAATTRRALELLATPPNGLFVIVVWDGEDTEGAMSAHSAVAEQAFAVYVSQQQSLSINPGQDILEQGADGGPGLLERVNDIRDRVRGLTLASGTLDEPIWYRGSQQVFDAGDAPVPLNAFRLRFTLRTLLPDFAPHSWQQPTS